MAGGQHSWRAAIVKEPIIPHRGGASINCMMILLLLNDRLGLLIVNFSLNTSPNLRTKRNSNLFHIEQVKKMGCIFSNLSNPSSPSAPHFLVPLFGVFSRISYLRVSNSIRRGPDLECLAEGRFEGLVYH